MVKFCGSKILFSFCLWSSSVFGASQNKYLIVSIDNRPLNLNVEANHYPSITAVLNKDYADHHGYGFVQFHQDITNLEKDVKLKYPKHNEIPPTDNAKDAATAFHVGLLQFRAASWAKLPALYHVLTGVGRDYDYIFYIDSDACISSLHKNRSLDDAMEDWKKTVALGNPDPTNASFIFFNNFPWRDDKPCAGTFLFRTAGADAIIREWWDFDLPSKNFKHFHEQDALWHMLENPSYGFKLNFKTVSILSERQFPSAWQRYEDLWLCHIASYNYMLRVPILTHLLRAAGLREQAAYAQAVGKLHAMKVDMLPPTEAMERASAQDPARIKVFPVHNLDTQIAWYDANCSSKNVEPLPAADLYEGRLICRKGEFWYVHKGIKRGFPNFKVFLEMGFEAALGFSASVDEIQSIPVGPLFAENIKENMKFVRSKVSQVNANGCVQHEELDQLVDTPGFKSIMYLVAHSNATEGAVQKFASCRQSWMKISRIHSTPFFESTIYRDVLPAAMPVWKGYEYVIIGTYKSVLSKGQTLDEMLRLLKVAKEGNWDIVPFLRSGSGNMGFSLYFHKQGFKDAWDALLTALGYSMDVIRKHDEMRAFFRNVFIVKPDVLEGLVTFMQKAIHIATTDQVIGDLLRKDSHYKEGSGEVAMRIFGAPYYQLHPFIFERLPSFYLHAMGAKICHATAGPCQYNT